MWLSLNNVNSKQFSQRSQTKIRFKPPRSSKKFEGIFIAFREGLSGPDLNFRKRLLVSWNHLHHTLFRVPLQCTVVPGYTPVVQNPEAATFAQAWACTTTSSLWAGQYTRQKGCIQPLRKPCKTSEGKTKYSLNMLLNRAIFNLFRLSKCLQEISLPSTTSIVVTTQQSVMQQL